jgi:exopolysaccharide biosynthesis polyprenyl glycosylphosphotransferase
MALHHTREASIRDSYSFPQLLPSARPTALPRLRHLGTSQIGADALSLLGALTLSQLLGFRIIAPGFGYAPTVVAAVVAWLVAFRAFGLYGVHRMSGLEELRRTLGAASIGLFLIVMMSAWRPAALSGRSVVVLWLLAAGFELLSRRAWRWYRARLTAEGHLALRTLIVGTNEDAVRLAEAISIAGSGFAPLGFVVGSTPVEPPYPLPLVGRVDRVDQAIRDHGAECVFLASTALGAEEMHHVMQSARRAGIEMEVATNLPEILTSRLMVRKVGAAMALSVRPVRFSTVHVFMKRAFDLAIVSVALVLSLPIGVLIAVAIRITSAGPALFRQERVTRGGRVFNMYKFRTMRVDADRILAEQAIDPTKPFFKLNGDPRLTTVGRLLRKLSLDELPQLLNVFKGEMSLVGPRPLPADQVEANMDLLAPRHEALAGMTGWWQINGRSSVSPEEAVKLDQFYIENWSLGLDLYILSKTLGAVLGQRGAI